MEKRVDEVLELLWIEVEALDTCQNVYRSFKIGGVFAGILDSFVYVLCRIADFDEFSCCLELCQCGSFRL